MPEAERTEVFEVPIDSFFEAIVDYAAYPDFVSALKAVEVHKQTKTKAHATFTAHSPIGPVHYTLDLKQKRPTHVSWTLVESNIFKQMDGAWTLTELEDGTLEVHYAVEVKTRIPAPPMLVRHLTAHGLPSMMRSFRDRALELAQ